MKTNLTRVNSSCLNGMAYDSADNTLVVDIKGKRYVYLNVSAETAVDLALAESKGKYFSRNIRDNYNCFKLVATK